jgi:hypothetical protein
MTKKTIKRWSEMEIMNNHTKKLKKLVESRKTEIVVTKQNTFKQYKRKRQTSSASDYCFSSFSNN